MNNTAGVVTLMASVGTDGPTSPDGVQVLVTSAIVEPVVSYPGYATYSTTCLRSTDVRLKSVRLYLRAPGGASIERRWLCRQLRSAPTGSCRAPITLGLVTGISRGPTPLTCNWRTCLWRSNRAGGRAGVGLGAPQRARTGPSRARQERGAPASCRCRGHPAGGEM